MDVSRWEQLYTKQKKRKKAVVVYLIIALAVLVGLTYGAFWSGLFDIKAVEMSGLQTLRPEQLLASLDVFFEQNPARFVSNRNFLFFPKDKITRYLQEHYSIIQSVNINKIFPNQAEVMVVERNPTFIVCSLIQTGSCFYIDEVGFIFTEAPQTEGSLITIIETDQELKAGLQIFKAETIKNLSEFRDLLKTKLNIPTKKIVMGEDVIFETYEGWQIKLDSASEFAERFNDLVLLLNSQIKENRSKLEYIDLTLPNRAYYRLK